MRFSARSPSPSPVRRRRSLSYGLQSSSYSSSSSEADDSQTDSSSESDEYSNSPSGSSRVSARAVRRTSHPSTSSSSRLAGTSGHAVGHVQINDTVAAIRLRTRHHDPYEEWAKRTRRDAFKTARREAAREAAREQDAKRQATTIKQDADDVARRLAQLSVLQGEKEEENGIRWNDQQKKRQTQIEGVIRSEIEKRRVEEERLARKKRNVSGKKLRRIEQARAQALEAQATERNALGVTTPDSDWRDARLTLKQLKSGPIARVKANRDSKKRWNEIRRMITPRVGQLTNEPQVIANISQQIMQILRPSPALPPDVYHASLSSLAKAILLQAETEVTAEKRSAKPLAQLALNSMNVLVGFSAVLWAKLCQRTGGWAIPAPVPSKDVDDTPFTLATHTKASGLREDETSADRTARVAGIMRVYFSLLLLPPMAPLSREFHTPRLWMFVAQLVRQPALLQSSLATELLSVALEVGGSHARNVWGAQWIKLMALLYEGVTTDPSPLGDSVPEARASRVRLQLEIERVMGSG
ncbi:GLE1-like protein-domain-containing protein [Russula aff. rugulosa BPL654]|nr:GLE1-like protein-domain-containing protein [Russula aff. rugulosa BPL654]